NYADHSGSGAPPEIFAALFGVWLDQQWGLLNHAPIYLLSLVPVAQAVRGSRVVRSAYAPELGQVQDLPLRRPSQRINAPRANALPWLALIALPYFALIVQYRYWWGEWCPPARYLTPILPLMVEPLVMAVARQTHARFRAIFALSSLLGWGVALAFALDGNLMYNHPLGQSRLLLALGGLWSVDLTRFEPSFIMMFLKEVDPAVWVVTQTALTLAWMAALGLAAWVAFGPWRRHTALKDS
ncbi:MAG: hypothetical protein HYR71_12345, partial [Chloroflexi bacterium]|nr:hypothetical protein [Chloroflexota bacterium]